jgi:hypothetical protein
VILRALGASKLAGERASLDHRHAAPSGAVTPRFPSGCSVLCCWHGFAKLQYDRLTHAGASSSSSQSLVEWLPIAGQPQQEQLLRQAVGHTAVIWTHVPDEDDCAFWNKGVELRPLRDRSKEVCLHAAMPAAASPDWHSSASGSYEALASASTQTQQKQQTHAST